MMICKGRVWADRPSPVVTARATFVKLEALAMIGAPKLPFGILRTTVPSTFHTTTSPSVVIAAIRRPSGDQRIDCTSASRPRARALVAGSWISTLPSLVAIAI